MVQAEISSLLIIKNLSEDEMKMLKCDSEGVPCIIQKAQFIPSTFAFRFKLFDGSILWIDAGQVQQMDLLTFGATREQLMDAETLCLAAYNKKPPEVAEA